MPVGAVQSSFSGHETFPFRYPWLKKGFDAVREDGDVFLRDDAITTLGVGKNMVRSIRHWCLAAGVLEENRTSNTDDSEKFVTGVVLNQDPWRITHLELLAIAHTGSAEVITRPGEVIEIANGYAATGVPILVEMLLKKSEPIWDVSNHLKKLVVSQQEPASE